MKTKPENHCSQMMNGFIYNLQTNQNTLGLKQCLYCAGQQGAVVIYLTNFIKEPWPEFNYQNKAIY